MGLCNTRRSSVMFQQVNSLHGLRLHSWNGRIQWFGPPGKQEKWRTGIAMVGFVVRCREILLRVQGCCFQLLPKPHAVSESESFSLWCSISGGGSDTKWRVDVAVTVAVGAAAVATPAAPTWLMIGFGQSFGRFFLMGPCLGGPMNWPSFCHRGKQKRINRVDVGFGRRRTRLGIGWRGYFSFLFFFFGFHSV